MAKQHNKTKKDVTASGVNTKTDSSAMNEVQLQ
jgi:hypothetical protein